MKKAIILILFLAAGTVLFSGFQCASPQMSSAKVAIKNKDYPKAKKYLEQEVQKNTTNGEAFYYLADIELKFGNTLAASDAYEKAQKYLTDPQLTQGLPILKYNVWFSVYEKARYFFIKYANEKQMAHLDSAIIFFKKTIELKPKNTDTYNLLGAAYEAKGDTVTAIDSYIKYTEVLEPSLTLAEEYQIFIGADRKELFQKLGKPLRTIPQKKDTLLTDVFKIKDKELYLHTQMDGNNHIVKGWRYDPPADWLRPEKEIWHKISLDPYEALAEIYFNKSDYEKSLNYIKKITEIEPGNIDANANIVQIYDILGKQDEAIKSIKDLVDRNPKNKYYRAQFGDLLAQMAQTDTVLSNKKRLYDQAMQQYEEALKIDPKYADVLRNSAASLKNKVVIIQEEHRELEKRNPNFIPNPEEYRPLLSRSAGYFKRTLETDKYKSDPEVMLELAEIYFVINEEQELQNTLNKMESLESSLTNDKLKDYSMKMFKIYDRMSVADKYSKQEQEQYSQKAESYMKKATQ